MRYGRSVAYGGVMPLSLILSRLAAPQGLAWSSNAVSFDLVPYCRSASCRAVLLRRSVKSGDAKSSRSVLSSLAASYRAAM